MMPICALNRAGIRADNSRHFPDRQRLHRRTCATGFPAPQEPARTSVTQGMRGNVFSQASSVPDGVPGASHFEDGLAFVVDDGNNTVAAFSLPRSLKKTVKPAGDTNRRASFTANAFMRAAAVENSSAKVDISKLVRYGPSESEDFVMSCPCVNPDQDKPCNVAVVRPLCRPVRNLPSLTR